MAEPPGRREPYVFISYSSRNRDRVLQIAQTLDGLGVRYWLDKEAIDGGTSYGSAIAEAIRNSAAVVVMCSERALASRNVKQEIQLAWKYERPYLPLLIEPLTDIPPDIEYWLEGCQWLEVLEQPEQRWLPRVVRALQRVGIETPATGERTAGSETTPAAVGAPQSGQDAPPAAHLPAHLTSFIGREQELAEITALLGTARLLTLSGPGGTGKTRLAIAAARRVTDRSLDGVWFVDLSGVADPAGVIPAIALLLDVRESEGRSLAVSLAAYLRRKQLLLVLDNFEQVIAAAMAVYDLLVEAPGLSLLVTSRVLLHVESEREYAVPPLPLPEAGAAAVPEQLGANPAVQLFVERAQAHRAGFRLSNENAAAVVAICRRLDGLPLAIELAAARVKLLPPAQLLARLEQRLAFLTGGERNRPQRQQTLRATIQWSWDLLSEAEQVLFRRLAVFAGGFTLEAAEAVCSGGGGFDVLEGLAALVDQSLMRQSEHAEEPRFSLLATLQEFALEQLEAVGEANLLRRRHAAYYCSLAEGADTAAWRTGRMAQSLLRPLDPERDNLLMAIAWALAEQDADVGVRLGGALGLWFYFRAPGEGLRWTEQLLGLPDVAALSGARGRSLWSAAACAIVRGDQDTAVAYFAHAAACLRAAEDLPALSRALVLLGTFLPAAEAERAQALAEEALRLARAADGSYNLAFVEAFAGSVLHVHGEDRTAARGHLEAALSRARSLGADWLSIYAVQQLALLAEVEGQHAEASALWLEALPLCEALGDRSTAGTMWMGVAQIAATAGDHDMAAAHWRRALAAAQELGNPVYTIMCLAGIAELLDARQRSGQAVQLLAASDPLRQAAEQFPFFGSRFLTTFTKVLAVTKAALSPAAFAQAWAEGQALSLDEATDLALTELAAAASGTDVTGASR